MFALFIDKTAYEVFADDPHLTGHDVRDVSHVEGFAPGWTANDDGSFSAPVAFTPSPVPLEPITRAQALIQLSRTPSKTKGKTLLDDVTAAVTEAGGELAIWFANAATWQRTNPYVGQIGDAVGLTSAKIDSLFTAAAQIEA